MPVFPPDAIENAVDAIERGELVVYPTETVYGLGADALDPAAVEAVFEAKGRDRSRPISIALPDIETADEYTRLTAAERTFLEAFLPGPVTVVVEREPGVPDILTAGSDRVGVRIPDHEGALELLAATGPITSTSANVSGTGSSRRVTTLDEQITRVAAAVLDGGETPGGGSTVVDVEHGKIHRRGARADAVEQWLADH